MEEGNWFNIIFFIWYLFTVILSWGAYTCMYFKHFWSGGGGGGKRDGGVLLEGGFT